MTNRYSSGIKGCISCLVFESSLINRKFAKMDASMQNVRTTNIVFRSRRVRNSNDSTPPKGASTGSIGRGPFTKNLVIPKDPVNKLRINV